MISKETSFSSSWSKEQEKEFENALAIHAEDCADRWEKIAAAVNGKSTDEIKHHYELLVEDINGIESGRVPLPSYSSDSPLDQSNETGSSKKNGNLGNSQSDSSHGGKGSKSEQERRKGVAWTEDEHRLFLLGLEKYGKGDWRSISRNFVVSRTPTQVASHAQKYFIRLNSMNKDRRRTSIHDITSVGNGETSASPGPITGQANAPLGSTTKSTKQSSQLPIPGPTIGMYGAPTIGQPVPGPMVSALGMPVNLPTSHMAYGVRATVPGIVPGAPMTMSPVTYPVQHTSGHR